MGEDQRQGAGTFVDLAALDADAPVLDHVDPTESVRTHHRVEFGQHQVQRRGHTVECHRRPPLKTDDTLERVLRRVRDGGRPLVDVVRRRDPRVFHGAALHRPADDVLVDRIRLLQRRGDRDAEPFRVRDRIGAAEPPDPNRREDLEIGRKRAQADLEPHLVVALPGTTVGDGIGVDVARRGHEMSSDDRTGQRGNQWVFALVERVGLDRVGDVPGRVLLACVHDARLDRSCTQGPLLDRVPVRGVGVWLLPDVDRECNDLVAPLLLDPLHRDRRVEAT